MRGLKQCDGAVVHPHKPQPHCPCKHSNCSKRMLSSAVRAPSGTYRLPARHRLRAVQAMGLFDFLKPKPAAGTKLAPKEAPQGQELATFAGGCFWGLELAYQRVPGVVTTSVGYIGGQKEAPSYEEVCMGFTGHTEAVQVTFKPDEVSYEQLLDVFFERVDPTTRNRQGNDRGTQYRSGIFWHTPAQKEAASKKIQDVNDKLAQGQKVRDGRPYEGKAIVSELTEAGDYWLAEDYHQQYLAKGGRMGRAQSAAKGCTDPIRCYG